MTVPTGGGDVSSPAKRQVPESITLNPRERSVPIADAMALASDVVRLQRARALRIIEAAPVVEPAAPAASPSDQNRATSEAAVGLMNERVSAPALTNEPLTTQAATEAAAEMNAKLRSSKKRET